MTSTELVKSQPFMQQVSASFGTAVTEVVHALSVPASRAGIAACLGTTAVLARMRVPFPLTLFVAIIAGETTEKAYAALTEKPDVGQAGS